MKKKCFYLLLSCLFALAIIDIYGACIYCDNECDDGYCVDYECCEDKPFGGATPCMIGATSTEACGPSLGF